MLGRSYRFTSAHLAAIVRMHEQAPAPSASTGDRHTRSRRPSAGRRTTGQDRCLCGPGRATARAGPHDRVTAAQIDTAGGTMAYAEKRGNLWRARWRGPDGTLESRPGFQTRKAAENYGRDQEAAIRGEHLHRSARGQDHAHRVGQPVVPGAGPRADDSEQLPVPDRGAHPARVREPRAWPPSRRRRSAPGSGRSRPAGIPGGRPATRGPP